MGEKLVPQLENFAESTLQVDIDGAETTLYIDAADADNFPEPSDADDEYAALTLMDGVQDPEIVYLTAKGVDGVIIVVRAQEGTSAQSWSSGTKVLHGPTKTSFKQLAMLASSGLLLCKKRIEGDERIPVGYNAISIDPEIEGSVTVPTDSEWYIFA